MTLEREGITALTRRLREISAHAAFRRKDPRGFAEFLAQTGEHDAQACAHMVGDEDAPCLKPSLAIRRLIPYAGLVVFPSSGHTLNIEEPGSFNLALAEFLATLDAGR